ncbi:hypothetical protein DFH07DRAFT_1055521 [Mycena maculata]|uniref:F-box domain-containing protein n=1 Tax=Mycena maculata TaxID=230809 RepID=A0AAD7NZP7_9AGAR|nr:hypothetical protein DFH07DRAFT_1055521 [Mycena maculata]
MLSLSRKSLPPDNAEPSTSRRISQSIRRALSVGRLGSSRRRLRKQIEADRVNSIALVTRLPPEILAHIFLLCVPNSWCKDLDWPLVTTRIIRRWREVALGCPELWANIVFRRKLLPVMLSRAKAIPLIIHANLDDPHFDPKFVRANIERVGSMECQGSTTALEEFFLDYPAGRVSYTGLRNLSVLHHALDQRPVWLEAMLFHASERTRRSRPPRRLRLAKCAFPWNSPWYLNLTDLHLSDLHKAQGPTMTVLFSVLVASPLLQDLFLDNTHVRRDGWQSSPSTELPHLRTIYLGETAGTCSQILENLSFPSIMTVSVNGVAEGYLTQSKYISRIVGHHDYTQAKYQLLRIELPSEVHSPCLRVTANSSQNDNSLCIEIYQTSESRPQSLGSEALTSFFDPLDCKRYLNITALHLVHLSLGAEQWKIVFHCRNIATLHLHDSDPLQLFRLLLDRAMRCIGFTKGADIEDRDARGHCKQLLPRLHLIALQGVDCGGQVEVPLIPFTSVLRSLLWARRIGRCPIANLRLEDCRNLFRQDLAHFNFFASVSWDGVGESQEEKEDGGDDIRSYSLNIYELLPISPFVLQPSVG